MEGDMWAARLLSKRQYAVHSMLDQHFTVDDVEGDEELRPDFACPYCFEGLDLLSLCSHLEDEHFSESRPVLCPVCAAKVGKDMISHITVHHGNLFKFQRRRKFRRPGITSHSGFPFSGKDMNQAHLQALLGACSPARTGSGIPDLFLSTLVCNMPISEIDDSSKLSLDNSDSVSLATSTAPAELSAECSLTAEEREQKLEEASVRSKFVRQLFLSTLWAEA
ncbi:protein DEHYDRATION-INDUCED 19 homolog 4 isoform X2 [Selaginella moellendorffii]|uniref:protein DEHYDRATION-INDUCED 19 homolog 4 isoform X2 n=1 Tax=Selaginella moellendorffii TaxID=88036 RepID=UPI000D1C22E5|nr:protein DEHYDRATION-INDUCED 19 homolog 4 isoform X2 [Selaginella moellendorffii]XP_024523150.1 protein DEHYDRATION-INDUCED 19 homolog 4 isoform X2 [Selaginella moellendorffii]|eukprot:XP_024517419.1 protein DEHYDRATION-INDUCED 19 homolog 4 isoform X2 [Selaginella moellendorffii]